MGRSEYDYMQWRRVHGAFQLTAPVRTKETLLIREERNLSVLLAIAEKIPMDSRWYPVFQRYVDVIADRVRAFGGDPREVVPSPHGHPRPREEQPPGKRHDCGELDQCCACAHCCPCGTSRQGHRGGQRHHEGHDCRCDHDPGRGHEHERDLECACQVVHEGCCGHDERGGHAGDHHRGHEPHGHDHHGGHDHH